MKKKYLSENSYYVWKRQVMLIINKRDRHIQNLKKNGRIACFYLDSV